MSVEDFIKTGVKIYRNLPSDLKEEFFIFMPVLNECMGIIEDLGLLNELNNRLEEHNINVIQKGESKSDTKSSKKH